MKNQQIELDFPPQKAYFIASLVLVDYKGQILLTKERNNYDIWTVPGGEVDYRSKEQLLDAALRETKEEIGVKLKKEETKLIDIRISYPEKDNPYKKYGILILVATYIAKFPKGQKIKLKRSKDEAERKYDVEKYAWVKPNEIMEGGIKIHDNFIKTIPRIKEWIESLK